MLGRSTRESGEPRGSGPAPGASQWDARQPGPADRAEIERIMVGLHGGDGSDGSEDEAHHAEIPAGEER